ncbi:ABC transporter substrate-binding protein [Aureimonas sp. ME7]|uniref:ABC transporter substrate-binding protein n=1 Tax=Aureimonas sp. ME7 TaxID=2744252 RepID=UPI001AED3495|nr:ABC transporter substrate-binding protein [Aureimonas sp. ME7]
MRDREEERRGEGRASARGLSRRAFLSAGALFAGLPALRPALAAPAPARIAIADWALLETCLALGHAPAAAVELVLFRRYAVEPPVTDAVVDLGLRGSLNFELLSLVAPDRIYGSNYSAWANEQMRRIAPVRELSIYRRGEKPFAKAQGAMRAMADDLGLADRAEAYIEALQAELAAHADAARRHAGRPLLVINIGDSRHFRAFGADSMFGEIGERLGFANAWGPLTRYSATAPVGVEALARFPDAIVVIVSPVPPDARRALPDSALWQAMPAVKAGRVVTIDPVNPFGGLPAARRFARLLGQALRELA